MLLQTLLVKKYFFNFITDNIDHFDKQQAIDFNGPLKNSTQHDQRLFLKTESSNG